ncbi:alpha/beta fold hydrolase [Streptomyces sp. NPDC085927]|uniref:alpha/beta fold hydrolase n=1 Tax=Streptomyces sp. NPDC085927 TaxID=3365738 RepID=UPI0037D8517F
MTTEDHGTSFARTDDGIAVAYQSRGTGRPLVLLAGQANNHHWWDGVRGDFDKTHRTITLDYRGTGTSDKPCDGYSTPRFAQDVVAVLDSLGIERADVYGTSMGGRVAQWIAARHPGRVRRLVLGCTSPGGPHAVERDTSVRRSLAQADPEAVRQTLTDLMYSPGWLARHSGPHHTLGDPTMPPLARRGHLLASDQHNAWEALPSITAPTLILHGDHDRLTPADNVALLAGRIPDTRTHLFPGARHAYFEECRPEAGALVRDFLS